MTSPPLDSTHGRMTSGVACHHRLWAANTIERRRDWNDITAFGQDTRSNDVGHGMTSLPLDSTHSQTTSDVACHHRLCATHRSKDVGRGMTSPPLDSTHGRQRRAWHDITTLGKHTRSATSWLTCHHRPWTAHTVRRRRAWHDITFLGKHTWSNDVVRGMPSSPLCSTHARTTSSIA